MSFLAVLSNSSENINTSSFVNIRQTVLCLFLMILLILVSGKTWFPAWVSLALRDLLSLLPFAATECELVELR